MILYVIAFNLFNPFVIGLFLFFVPYSLRYILPTYSHPQFLIYFIGFILLFITIIIVGLYLRSLIEFSTIYVFLPIILVLFLYLNSLFANVTFESISNLVFNLLSKGSIWFIIIEVIALITFIYICSHSLKRNLYGIYQNESFNIFNLNFFILNPYRSDLNYYVLLEIKLIIRNKRTRGFLLLALIMLVLFYNVLPQNNEGFYFTFIVYILLSGIFGYIFSQYMFSWESSFFDFILSKKFDLRKYLKAKYLIYLTLGVMVFIVFIPILKPSIKNIHLFFSAILYNSSLGYFISFFLATHNKDRIDLSRNIFFNLQGINSMQVLGLLLVLLIPSLILFLLSFVINMTQSLLILNLLCFIAIINQKKGWDIIIYQLLKRKYINMEGYRK